MMASENDAFYDGNSSRNGKGQVKRKPGGSGGAGDKFGANNKKELIKKSRAEI
jgi:hypothetical protein